MNQQSAESSVDGSVPLAELHHRLGASMERIVDGMEVPAHYGSTEEEYAALRAGCGLLDRSWISALEVLGEDRQRFLNGMVTCDVGNLTPGEGVYGFLTDIKGHVLADVVVRADEDRFWLELPPGRSDEIGRHLEKFIVADRVEIVAADDPVPVTLLGPQAPEVLADLASSGKQPPAPWSHTVEEIFDHSLPVSADGGWGVPALSIWLPAADAPTLFERILEAGKKRELAIVGFRAADLVRLEAGIPRFGRDFGPENLPQETGLADAVDYEKGCYLGQEVVARLHYRGQASRMLRGMVFDSEAPSPAGAKVLFDGREAGTVKSAARSPALDRSIGLALLQRRAAEIGTSVEVKDVGQAEVVELPFVSGGG